MFGQSPRQRGTPELYMYVYTVNIYSIQAFTQPTGSVFFHEQSSTPEALHTDEAVKPLKIHWISIRVYNLVEDSRIDFAEMEYNIHKYSCSMLILD